ncbi:MAG: lactate utilization protein [Lachnospiraceae bacterium]|nr:lactate utilization protein [Lachnospiraceae bacterium]
MSYVKQAFAQKANVIIENLKKRNMEGFYCETSAEACEKILSMMEEGSTIAWGGSESLKECGLMDELKSCGKYNLIDRATAKSPEEDREIYAKTVCSDYYLMSTNAITMDGELVNIDGNGNRVACLIHGPKQVILVVGMNKVVTDVGSGLSRTQNVASPPNTIRLNKKTPCAVTGVCGGCLSPDSICCQVVITRKSKHDGRIKVFLVAEDLGF